MTIQINLNRFRPSYNNIFQCATIHYININGYYDEQPFLHVELDFQICI